MVSLEDKVTEEQMAALLGTTNRALQARRARKQIPDWAEMDKLKLVQELVQGS